MYIVYFMENIRGIILGYFNINMCMRFI